MLDLSTTGKLTALGLDMTKYGQLSYAQRIQEYPAPQQIAEIAFFYEYQAIMVPNARWPSSNVAILTENVRPSQVEARESEIVDLSIWASKHWKRGQSHAD